MLFPQTQEVTFTVIIPTVGRDTLTATLASIKRQDMLPGDEVLVIGDGHHPSAERVFHESGLNGRYMHLPAEGKWGRVQREHGISIAKGSYIMFLDDDDIHVEGMWKVVREAVAQKPGLYLYKTLWPDGCFKIPKAEEILCGNVTTGCIVTANVSGKIGEWWPSYDQDYHFARTTAELWGPEHVFYPPETLTLFKGQLN